MFMEFICNNCYIRMLDESLDWERRIYFL